LHFYPFSIVLLKKCHIFALSTTNHFNLFTLWQITIRITTLLRIKDRSNLNNLKVTSSRSKAINNKVISSKVISNRDISKAISSRNKGISKTNMDISNLVLTLNKVTSRECNPLINPALTLCGVF